MLALSAGEQPMQLLHLCVTAALMTSPPLPHSVPVLAQPVGVVYHGLASVKPHFPPINTTGVLLSFVSLSVSGFIADVYTI